MKPINLSISLILLFLFFIEGFAQNPGSLDTTFGSGGSVATHLNVTATVFDMAVQPDGKIVVVGTTFNPSNAALIGTVARFNVNGTLDTTFDGNGFINTGLMREVSAVQILPGGKILIGGYDTVGNNGQFCITRLNSDGSKDTTFDGDGVVVTNVGIGSHVRSLNVLPDGKIIAVGDTSLTDTFSNYDYALVKYNADGSLDTTFGTGGRVATELGSTESANDSVILSDGKIIVAGDYRDALSNQKWAAILRYNADGTLDTTFGTNGKVFKSAATNADAKRVAIQTDGKIIIVGDGIQPSRYNSDGTPDISFNTPAWSYTMSLAIQSDGKLLVGGGDTPNSYAVVRYNTNGTPDTGFGSGGKISAAAVVRAISIAPDGKIVVGGTRLNSGFEIVLSRYYSAKGVWMDFDGDGKADVSVFRPSENKWYVLRSSDFGVTQQVFALADDVPVPADYDGDGKTDLAIFRQSSGDWWSLSSVNGAHVFGHSGQSGDIPRPSDFDGDGRADYIVFRPSNNTWYRTSSANGAASNQVFGLAGDKPVTGDFDGDGKADKAIYRPDTGDWWWQSSVDNGQRATHWGISTDVPAPADFDGDGKTDFAVYRPSTGIWYIVNSGNSSFTIINFGIAEDKPAPADYDGDGKADIAVFRPSTGIWYLLQSTDGFRALAFGISTDIPNPNAFVP